IKDSAGNAANLTVPAPGATGSLGKNKDIVINTTAPSITSVSSTTANGTYAVASPIPIPATFCEAVNVTGPPNPALNSRCTATSTSGSGPSTLTFTYPVGA